MDRAGRLAPAQFEAVFVAITVIITSLLGTAKALPVACGCDSRISHYLVDRVSGLRDDELHV